MHFYLSEARSFTRMVEKMSLLLEKGYGECRGEMSHSLGLPRILGYFWQNVRPWSIVLKSFQLCSCGKLAYYCWQSDLKERPMN